MLPRCARLVPALAFAAGLAAQSVANFESGPVQPLRLSADGTRLFVADTVGGRLCVFDLRQPSAPFLLAEIPVGLDPVSVQPRTRDEVWVVNQLSDSVSIVSVPERRVVHTLRVVDEPSDVVFAGGKAFVSAATTDEVEVFDAATRAPLGVIPLFGKDPRALAVSPDGTRVYAVIQRSGNGTTVLPAGVQAPPPSQNGVPAPAQGILVRANDPAWAAQIPYTLPDNDVAQIDVATQTVTRYFRGVGTTNTAIAVHPVTGDLWVANTEARNLVRFEPQLRGHAIDSRVTRITTGAVPTVTPFDLNPGLDYGVLPNAAALATALSEPFGTAVDAAAGLVYVAAHGTDRIGVLDLAGNVVGRIEVGSTPGAIVDTRRKRGPRALALHPTQGLLYVLNRLSDTLAVVDRASWTVLGEQPIATWDPLPASWREGRNFLYDAKLSGNGTMSCAACHVDGDIDGIAWDLGDPAGPMESPPAQPFPFSLLSLSAFHPMKGPMTTQTLRGLAGTGVLHWRGDRTDFQAFNGAFDKLMGGSLLPAADMNDYAAFVATLRHPPNPNQLLDRSLRTAPAGNNEAAGLAAFQQNIGSFPLPGGASCATCHALPSGTNGIVFPANILQEPQQMKVPQLRNLYRKVGFQRTAAPQKIGFGFTHDGAVDTLTTFFALPVFNPWPAATKDDLVTFMLAFDTGTAPLTGYQFHLDRATAGSPGYAANLALATARAAAGDVELTAHGRLDGELRGLLYQSASGQFVTDRTGVGPFTAAQLQAKAQAGTASLVFTAVPPGTGQRLALDRDLDGVRNGDEAAVVYGVAVPGCDGEPSLRVNSEPRRGNLQFGHVMESAPAQSLGILGLALGASAFPAIGVTIQIDPTTAVLLGVASDAFGSSWMPFPVAATETLGLQVFGQVVWLDLCGPELFSSSRGLHFTVGP
ncbi:MAG: YncE family protein [Planctomycetes bacterium]|nr:YncE family protein [Planctomycetota bacterium]